MHLVKFFALFVAVTFLAPMAAASVWWASNDTPTSWRTANWSATGLLPDPAATDDAAIYVLAARTGGFRGAFAVHSWIVLKSVGSIRYERYDKVGWGSPIRRDAYSADAAWYSNEPWIVARLDGRDAEAALPMVRAAIASYPHGERGDYRIWPGPNSNSFVAHVLREVPAIDTVLPPNAVGRNFLPNGNWFALDPDGRDLHVSIAGLAGFSAGWRSGIEFHLLGQTLGIDIKKPALKLPAIGRVGL
ncbi:DUF3750 domain-containing protein [Oricola sp.]|uniref:DUF3750 domain-containing protein n=1 Tax=Oricola sp. TaxID=1979950 RepID=UPI003BAC2A55